MESITAAVICAGANRSRADSRRCCTTVPPARPWFCCLQPSALPCSFRTPIARYRSRPRDLDPFTQLFSLTTASSSSAMSVVAASAGSSTLNGASGSNSALSSSSGSGGSSKGKELTPDFLAELKKAFSKNIIKVRRVAAQRHRAGRRGGQRRGQAGRGAKPNTEPVRPIRVHGRRRVDCRVRFGRNATNASYECIHRHLIARPALRALLSALSRCLFCPSSLRT